MNKKSKIKKRDNYYKYRGSERTYFQMELYSIISRISKEVFLIIGVPLLWYLCFIYYPLTTMVDVKGIVVEKQFSTTGGGGRGSSRSYTVTLNNCATPLELYLNKNRIDFREIQEGEEIIVQVQRKDIDRIINSNGQRTIDKYSFLFKSVIRMYGIRTNEKVIITSKRALWNFSGPYIPYTVGSFAVLFVLLFGTIFLYYDLKSLFILLWNKRKGEDMKK